MTAQTSTNIARSNRVAPMRNFATVAWVFMRYSGILLIPLAFGHIILQDVVVGVHKIDINYVELRWSLLAWRIYDIALLALAFAHGMNGLRQVLMDYVQKQKTVQLVSWVLFLFWALLTIIGAIAIIGGVSK